MPHVTKRAAKQAAVEAQDERLSRTVRSAGVTTCLARLDLCSCIDAVSRTLDMKLVSRATLHKAVRVVLRTPADIIRNDLVLNLLDKVGQRHLL